MFERSKILAGLLVIIAVLVLMPYTSSAQSEKVQVLSRNKIYHTKGDGQDLDYYEVSPFSPLQFKVSGPGKLVLSLIKTYTVAEGKKALDKASFQIYKDGSLLATIEHGAEKNPGVIFAETTEFLPGKPQEWSLEVSEGEELTIGVLVTPNKGAIGIKFEEPEEEPLALVPLVPLVPVEPEAAAPVAKPVAEKKEEQKDELPKPVDELVVKDEPEKKKEEKQGEKIPVVSIEPRLGVNLSIQSRKINNVSTSGVNPMFTAGLALKYILPVWDQRLRIGAGFDYSSYGYDYLNVSPNTDIHVRLLSIPMQVEFDAFILTKGIFRPFVGLGGGVNYTEMKHETVLKIEDKTRTVNTKNITYAFSFWAGCQFAVWNGGPFVKMRYTVSMADYDDPPDKDENPNIPKDKLLTNADHGGLSFLAGYQFEF